MPKNQEGEVEKDAKEVLAMRILLFAFLSVSLTVLGEKNSYDNDNFISCDT